MSEVRLDQILLKMPAGMPLPVACWLVARVAKAAGAEATTISASDVRLRADGGVRVVQRERDKVPFWHRPPEVILGGPPTPRSFVFALGALLVECTTGRHPFQRESDLETRLAVCQEGVPPLTGRVAQASPALDVIMERALAKRPGDRYEDGFTLATHLDGFLDDELLEVGRDDLVDVLTSARSGMPVPRRPTPGPGALSAARPRGTPPPNALRPARTAVGGQLAPEAHETQFSPPSNLAGPTVPGASPADFELPAPISLEMPIPPDSDDFQLPPPVSLEQALPLDSDLYAEARRDAGFDAEPTEVDAMDKATDPEVGPPRALRGPTAILEAKLDMRPQARRAPAPIRPKFEDDVMRVGTPGLERMEITQGGTAHTPPSEPPPALAVGVVDIDHSALNQQRERIRTVLEEPAAAPPPNWMARIVVGLIGLLALALVYQFLVRPLLRP